MLDCGIHMVQEQKFPDFHFLRGEDVLTVKKSKPNVPGGMNIQNNQDPDWLHTQIQSSGQLPQQPQQQKKRKKGQGQLAGGEG
jgi:hypothetical protein